MAGVESEPQPNRAPKLLGHEFLEKRIGRSFSSVVGSWVVSSAR